MARFGCTITVAAGKAPSSQSNFTWAAVTANFPSAAIDGGSTSLNNLGGNLKCYTDSGKGTRLPVEVVKFITGGSPSILIWGKSPTLNVASTVYMEADTVATSQPANTATFGRNAVWSDFEACYHFNSSNKLTDSTGNHDLTQTGTITNVTGLLGDAIDCAGSYSNRMTAASYKGITGGTARTVSFWAKATSSTDTGVTSWGVNNNGQRYSVYFSSGNFRTEVQGGFKMASSGATTGQYKRYSSILTSSSFPGSCRHRIDGVTTTGDSQSGSRTVNTVGTNDLEVAALNNFGGATIGSEVTDEYTLRAFAITDDFESTEVNNQSDPASFWTTSAWENQDAGVDSSIAYTVLAPAFSVGASSSVPVFNTSIAYAIDAPTFSAGASVTVPGNNASISYSISSPTFAADSTVINPAGASVSFDVLAPTFASSASSTAPNFDASIAFDVSAPTFSVVATRFDPGVVSNINFTLDAPTFSASASITIPNNDASAGFDITSPLFAVIAGTDADVYYYAKGTQIILQSGSRLITVLSKSGSRLITVLAKSRTLRI